MENYIIMTDSSCDLPQRLVDELKVDIVPLSVTIGGRTYQNYADEREITAKSFYNMLRDKKEAVTSAVNIDGFVSAMEPHLQQGLDVLYLAFSSALSSTCQSAQSAAIELQEKYPERKIFVVDTLSASLGQGLLVYLTAKEREEGRTIEQARDFAENTKLKVCHWFTVDDLHHLRRGGRISSTTAMLGTILTIKPILHVDNEGRLISVGKSRGRKASIKALAARMERFGVSVATQQVFISHGDCLDEAELLAGHVRALGVRDIVINNVGPVIGTHSGPGTLALFFIGTER